MRRHDPRCLPPCRAQRRVRWGAVPAKNPRNAPHPDTPASRHARTLPCSLTPPCALPARHAAPTEGYTSYFPKTIKIETGVDADNGPWKEVKTCTTALPSSANSNQHTCTLANGAATARYFRTFFVNNHGHS